MKNKNQDALNKLKEHNLRTQIKELKRDLIKQRFLDRLIFAQKAKVMQQFYRLGQNRRDQDMRSLLNKEKQRNLLNYLLNNNHKMRSALNSLRNFNDRAKDHEKKQAQAINDLFDNMKKKQEKALNNMVKNNLLSGIFSDSNRLNDKIKYLEREKLILDLFQRMANANEAKQRQALKDLMKHNDLINK